MKIGMILFENLTQLDLTGPYEVFNRLPDTQIYLIAETITAIKSDGGMEIMSNITFHGCPLLDILFVPGGPGVSAAMENTNLMAFLIKQSLTVQYITSVCTGSLVLGMAGLLRDTKPQPIGYHWIC